MRIRRDWLGQIAGQVEQVRVFFDPRLAVGLRHAEDIRHEVQIFDAGEELVQVRVIRNVGQLLLAAERIGLDGLAVDVDLALLKLQDPGAALDRCGLARAVVADKAVDLAGPDVQAQIVDSFLFSICFAQMLDFQHQKHPFLCVCSFGRTISDKSSRVSRVYLKTVNAPGQRAFSRCRSHQQFSDTP